MSNLETVLQQIWDNPSVKQELTDDPKAFLKSHGMDIADSVSVTLHEDRPSLQNFVIPAKVEGFKLEGDDPKIKVVERAWQDEAFKKQLLENPKQAVSDMGIAVAPGLEIKVWEESANAAHLVLPVNPSAGELSDADLEAVAGGLSKGNQIAVACGTAGTVSGIAGATLAFTVAGGVITGVWTAANVATSTGGAIAQSEIENK